ncbi:formate/nitrite transporter family protein [Mollicutes bacterium LVI A0078]|nr:formate/nitrite transporter family protein [Mollicutes bacterium LVI A0075]WOO91118.1 formate/nitrite transporter family protein [Mollicutes bacterium LVI A0078]
MEQIKTNLDQDFVDYVSHGAEVKENLANKSFTKFVMRAMMAGMLLTFMYMTFYSVEALFEGVGNETTNLANVGMFYGAWIFAFALIFIYYTKSELLTSNMMGMTLAKLENKTSWAGFTKVLTYTYVGNLLGGLFVAILIAGSTIITPDMQTLMAHTAETKLSYVQAGPSGYLDLLIRAIWCNFFINLGMLPIYMGLAKSDFGKIISIFGAIFVFMRLGFEHSVANTVFFILVAVTGTAHMSLATVIPSLVVAIIGNWIGGGILIGASYVYLNREK